MSGRRLVQRSRQSDAPTPGQQHRPRAQEEDELHELPPYEVPTCTLSAAGRRALLELGHNYDYSKLEKHLKEAKRIIPATTADCYDRVAQRRERLDKEAQKKRKEGQDDAQETEEEKTARLATQAFERKAKEFSVESEKAMRDLIDYDDELHMHSAFLDDVSAEVNAAPEPEDGPDGEPGANTVSAIELFRTYKSNHSAAYEAKSMLER